MLNLNNLNSDNEISESEIKNYFEPMIKYKERLDKALKNDDLNFKMLFQILFQSSDYYYYHSPINTDNNEDIYFKLDLFWRYINEIKENLKYDFPPFYDLDTTQEIIYFKFLENYYFTHIDDYSQLISKYDISDKDRRIKYYLDLNDRTIKQFNT